MQTITKRIALMSGALMLIAGVGTADAQPRHGVVIVPRVGIYRPYVYAPYWGPWHPPAYTYTYGYPIGGDANIRTKVDPKNTEIFVDGYFAGFAREFDGGHRLHVTPGGHAITMHLDGYRTVTEEIWVEPSRTVTLKTDMTRLARGEASAPVPSPTWPESREPR
jgi:hypothetical protein